MRRSRTLAVAIAFVSLWAVMAAGITAVWVTDEVRVLGAVTLATAIVASLLVLYFKWRGALRRRILAERDAQRNGRVVLDKAA